MRRELLWLRAREREDEASIECLERADPAFAERMQEMELDLDLPREPRERSRAFGRRHDERYAEMMVELLLAEIVCECSGCQT